MFIWNNIFLTFAFDSRDNYTDVGGKSVYRDISVLIVIGVGQ